MDFPPPLKAGAYKPQDEFFRSGTVVRDKQKVINLGPAGKRCISQYYTDYPRQDDYRQKVPDFREPCEFPRLHVTTTRPGPENDLPSNNYCLDRSGVNHCLEGDKHQKYGGGAQHFQYPHHTPHRQRLPEFKYNILNHLITRQIDPAEVGEQHSLREHGTYCGPIARRYEPVLFPQDLAPQESDPPPKEYYVTKWDKPGYPDTRKKTSHIQKWAQHNFRHNQSFGVWHKYVGPKYFYRENSRRL